MLIINKFKFSIFTEEKSIIHKLSLHPDGHSFCVAFIDKIKFYRVLINKFKPYAEFQYKKCSFMAYSNGGQLIACTNGRNNNTSLVILNTARFNELCSFKLGYNPEHIVWN